MVKEFAKDQGLEYAEFKFVDGNKEVLGVLRGVAEQVRFMAKVADHEAMEMAGSVRREHEPSNISEKKSATTGRLN